MPTGWSTAKTSPMARTAVHCDGIGRLSQQRGWAGGVHDKTVGIATAARRAAPGSHRLGARASRPHPVPLAAAELQCDAAGSHPCRREPQRPGRRRAMAPFPVDPSGGDGRGCARLGAGGTPALPGSRHPMTSSTQGHQIAEAFWCRLWLKEVHLYSCVFVFIRGSSSFINDRPFFLE